MKMFKEFKEFAMRGNVVDMAVGIVIGGAFGRIVSSFINDVLMPPLGVLIGNADFSELCLNLTSGRGGSKPVVLSYGKFITSVIDFLIIAFAVFIMVRIMNKMKPPDPAPITAPTDKKCPECRMNVPLDARRCGHCAQPIAL